jgi:hypothetical protein
MILYNKVELGPNENLFLIQIYIFSETLYEYKVRVQNATVLNCANLLIFSKHPCYKPRILFRRKISFNKDIKKHQFKKCRTNKLMTGKINT